MIKIKKVGRYGVFESEIPKKLESALFNRLAYQRQGAEFMPNKAWSWVRFYNKKKRCWPWGLKKRVLEILKQWKELSGDKFSIEKQNKLTWKVSYRTTDRLREYQREAIEALIINEGGIVSASCGAGKTRIAIEFLKTITFKEALIVVTGKDLRDQWLEEIKKNKFSGKVYVYTYQLLHRHEPDWLKSLDVVINDECLVGHTKIDTEEGPQTIKNIVEKKIKTNVVSYNIKEKKYELKPIVGYFKSPDTREIYNIKIKNKKTGRVKILKCTKEHKWFTKRGYRVTTKLKKGDKLFHREYVCPKCLKICKGEKSIGGHYNTVHLNPNSERNKELLKRIGRTISRKVKSGEISNSFLKVGNGRGMSKLERYCYKKFLNRKWKYNYPVSLGKKKKGFPSCYKIDFYNDKLKISIEVDGKGIHDNLKQKKLDKKKDKMLKKLGYKILRLSEETLLSFKSRGEFKKWMNGKL